MVAYLTSFVWTSPGHWPFYGRCYSEPLCVFDLFKILQDGALACLSRNRNVRLDLSAAPKHPERHTSSSLTLWLRYTSLRTSQVAFLWWACCVLHIWGAKSRPLKSVLKKLLVQLVVGNVSKWQVMPLSAVSGAETKLTLSLLQLELSPVSLYFSYLVLQVYNALVPQATLNQQWCHDLICF